jgi:hypothetical protein
VATSAGITVRVLQEMRVLRCTESRVILGAAVIDDILTMLVRNGDDDVDPAQEGEEMSRLSAVDETGYA